MPPTAALGVHIAAGVAWLAVASAEGDFVSDPTDRLEAEIEDLPLGRSFSEFEEGFEALLRRLEPAHLAILDPGKSRQQPKATVSRRRGAVEALATLAAFRTNTDLERVTHDQVEKVLGHPPSQSALRDHLAGRLAVLPARWNERAPAFAAALTVIADE